MDASWIPVAVFALCYALFVAFPRGRSIVACAGALTLVLTGSLTWRQAAVDMVSWNVIGLFFGTLVLAELFMQSRMPAVMAEWMIRRTRTALGAMVMICVLASVLSIFLENVAVVLLVAPVALSLCAKLGVRPVRLLVLVAVCSNLQGTATLIGDPPSMILAGAMRLSFNDFFVYRGRPSIFFAVQAGALASFALLPVLLRGRRTAVDLPRVETPRSLVPSALLLALVAGLMSTHWFDPEFRWMAGAVAMGLAVAGVIWYLRVPHWGTVRGLIATLDWDTTFFLIGIFVIVGGLGESGWLDRLASGISAVVGGNLLLAFALIVAVAVVVSGFVDNVPFLLAMIPVVRSVAESVGAREPALLLFALLIGSCLGGNITPIGASANIVAMGMLRRHGHPVGFGEFMRLGIPFTVAAVLAGCAFLWVFWT